MSELLEFFFAEGWGREILRTIQFTAAAALVTWFVNRQMNKRARREDKLLLDKEEKIEEKAKEQIQNFEEREKAVQELRLYLVRSNYANLRFADAIADAIEQGKTNGKMTKAREVADKILEEQHEFLSNTAFGSFNVPKNDE